MKKILLAMTASFGMTFFAGFGVTAVGLMISPGKAEARCYWRWKKSWRCVRRYGRRSCRWHTHKYKTCSGRYGRVTRSYHRDTAQNPYGTTTRSHYRKVYRTRYGTKTYHHTRTRVRTRYGVRTYDTSRSYYQRNCVWRRFRKSYCTRGRGYYTRVRAGSYNYPYWKRVWVPGRQRCSYRWYTRKVCG